MEDHCISFSVPPVSKTPDDSTSKDIIPAGPISDPVDAGVQIGPEMTGGVQLGGGSGETGVTLRPAGKRGRPRKYDEHGIAYASPVATCPPLPNPPETLTKRGRGRPRGSGRRYRHLSELSGIDAETGGSHFTTMSFAVNTGEDIVGRISYFANDIPQAVCVLNAVGMASHVAIRHPGSNTSMIYEGQLQLLSLSGSYVYGTMHGSRRKRGYMSVAFTNADGRVVGGAVAGPIMAAAPVQVILSTFNQAGKRQRKKAPKRSSKAQSSSKADEPSSSILIDRAYAELRTLPVRGGSSSTTDFAGGYSAPPAAQPKMFLSEGPPSALFSPPPALLQPPHAVGGGDGTSAATETLDHVPLNHVFQNNTDPMTSNLLDLRANLPKI